jgi:hypothetical protein
MFQGVVEVMYFVSDRKVAANWYSQLLDLPITYLDEPEHYFICTGAQDIWFSLADSKVPRRCGRTRGLLAGAGFAMRQEHVQKKWEHNFIGGHWIEATGSSCAR